MHTDPDGTDDPVSISISISSRTERNPRMGSTAHEQTYYNSNTSRARRDRRALDRDLGLGYPRNTSSRQVYVWYYSGSTNAIAGAYEY